MVFTAKSGAISIHSINIFCSSSLMFFMRDVKTDGIFFGSGIFSKFTILLPIDFSNANITFFSSCPFSVFLSGRLSPRSISWKSSNSNPFIKNDSWSCNTLLYILLLAIELITELFLNSDVFITYSVSSSISIAFPKVT